MGRDANEGKAAALAFDALSAAENAEQGMLEMSEQLRLAREALRLPAGHPLAAAILHFMDGVAAFRPGAAGKQLQREVEDWWSKEKASRGS
ncbi:hypothetical protein [Psychromarinibacter halotolerans]|uniref:Uncharacterized protein n=1 Tax=Psychromarinibacter halotolerans TaxID=1775175 RepID=A0ABV7GUH5_9RHOB|nr:hypothetical protein [Psychromarinibacter halotolerans]MDF0598972.1 hypothetical protein [Psychromarinibacter halotolerans]